MQTSLGWLFNLILVSYIYFIFHSQNAQSKRKQTAFIAFLFIHVTKDSVINLCVKWMLLLMGTKRVFLFSCPKCVTYLKIKLWLFDAVKKLFQVLTLHLRCTDTEKEITRFYVTTYCLFLIYCTMFFLCLPDLLPSNKIFPLFCIFNSWHTKHLCTDGIQLNLSETLKHIDIISISTCFAAIIYSGTERH